jgi:hypothetical protein
MTSLGIFKPYKKVFFHDDREDLSAVSYEVVNVAKIFAERGHNVTMLSPTDLEDDFEFIGLRNIRQGRLEDREHFDRVFLFSGSFAKDSIGEAVIPFLRLITPRLDFLLTDLRLQPSQQMWKSFTKVYTQATSPLDIIPQDIPQQYGGIAELDCYKLQRRTQIEKDIDYAFFGTERGRLQDILEYVKNDECLWIGKSDTFNFDTRVPRDKFKEMLDKVKFSIVIADEEYNKNKFITPRLYEHTRHHIITFVDDKFDRDFHLEPQNSFYRVKNREELFRKMNLVKSDDVMQQMRLQQQWNRITSEMINGNYVYKKLDGNGK